MPGKKSKVVAASAAKTQPKTRKLKPSSLSLRPAARMSDGLTAPLAVSRNRTLSYSYSSVSIDGQSGLRVTACVPICEIGNDTHNNGLFMQSSATTGAFSASCVAPSLYSLPIAESNGAADTPSQEFTGVWISPHIPLLALAFDRYRHQRLAFHYEPQSAATVADRLVFAWTDDPYHPFLSPTGIDTLGKNQTQLNLLVTKDSVAFMPWKQWSLEVPVSREPKYIFDDTAGTGGNQRFSLFGALSCVGSAAPSPVQYGILYVSMTVDLYDPVPLIQIGNVLQMVRETLSRHHARLRKNCRLIESKEEKKETAAPPTPHRLVMIDSADGVLPDIEDSAKSLTRRGVREPAAPPSRPPSAPKGR